MMEKREKRGHEEQPPTVFRGFSDPQWREKLVTFTRDRGRLSRDDAIDYFVFPRDSKLTVLPPFAVGRPACDNYFVFRCRQLSYPLIDATSVVTAVHQNHDYAHVPKGTGYLWHGPEADANIALLGEESRRFTVGHATHKLTAFGLKKTARRWDRSTYLALHPRQKMFVQAIIAVRAVLRRIGLLPSVHWIGGIEMPIQISCNFLL